ncbi:hypothetical protein AHiyo6_21870 [Arthrobacter sp. Hiyo6]|nr:hypothetical protein AHiyo6_21870 [Arthrobacter sp. Hiyo6]
MRVDSFVKSPRPLAMATGAVDVRLRAARGIVTLVAAVRLSTPSLP